MKKFFTLDGIVIIIFSMITIFTFWLFRYTDSVILMLLFFGYLFYQIMGFFAITILNLKKDKIKLLISVICLVLSVFLFIKSEEICYYINTHHRVSTYLKENESFKGAKIIGLANDKMRIIGPQYSINYVYNIKMPDNKIIQGYYYRDTTGPFGGPDMVETNYLYYYKDELVTEFNKKYNSNIYIDCELSNQYIFENITYTMGSAEEILNFVDFIRYKYPELKYEIRVFNPSKESYSTYSSENIYNLLKYDSRP